MKNHKIDFKKGWNTKTFKVGTYSFLVGVVVLAILIVVNVLSGVLPESITQLDISSARLYSVTSNTKVIVNALEEDVTIYWICQEGSENTVIEKLLGKYEALSSHIKVVRKNPDIYPTFAEQYTSSGVTNNDLIVESGDQYRYIAYSDIIETSGSYYSYEYYFDGEGEITSAIRYVTSDDLPVVYVLTGHNEDELSDDFASGLEKANIETEEFSLLTVDEVPEEADLVLINSPETDISETEKEMLIDYIGEGGRLLVFNGPKQDGNLENLDALLSYYGVETNDGILVESDRTCYAYGYPYLLLPTIEDTEITEPLLEGTHSIVVPIAEGLTVRDSSDRRSSLTVETLLSTSDTSFSKLAGYDLTTYDFEDGDFYGPFALAVAITDSDTSGEDGKLVWISSDNYIAANSDSSDANMDLVLNAISWMTGETDTISIRAKSMNTETLSISTAQATLIKWVILFIIPALFLCFGLAEVLRRRRLR